MKRFDSVLKGHGKRYVLQSLLAGLSVMAVILALDVIGDPAVVASLGASAFILFVMPSRQVARPQNVLGGYAIGILSGMLALLVADSLPFSADAWEGGWVSAVFGGIGVSAAVLGMAVLNLEHPPAAGMALSLVLGGGAVIQAETWLHALTAVAGVMGLVVFQQLIHKYLVDLL